MISINSGLSCILVWEKKNLYRMYYGSKIQFATSNKYYASTN